MLGCQGAEVQRCTALNGWYHDMQWHHERSPIISPCSTAQVFLSFREFCITSKAAFRRTPFPWDKATIDA